jgi:ribosomal protein L7/L12
MEDRSREIADLIRQGKKIEAIKLLREQTGLGLKEARDKVERLSGAWSPRAGYDLEAASLPRGDRGSPSGEVPREVVDLALSGNKIGAIKLLREQTGLGLKEAKDRVEQIPGVGRSGCLGSALLVLAAFLLAALAP